MSMYSRYAHAVVVVLLLVLVVVDDVEVEVLVEDEVELVVIVFPNLSCPAIFCTPPILLKSALIGKSTWFCTDINLVDLRWQAPLKSKIGYGFSFVLVAMIYFLLLQLPVKFTSIIA